MHIDYDDIRSRIKEPPKWWLDGVPRYEEFQPGDLDVYASEALLVHIRCQSCRHDFHIGLCGPRPHQSFRSLLLTQRRIGVGDPPRGCPDQCTGASETSVEVAVLQFWERKGTGGWTRVPELERGLWESDEEISERHREAWRRIRLYKARPADLVPAWTPLPTPPEFPLKIPRSVGDGNKAGTGIDIPALNTRRRLALLALAGQVTAEEFAALQDVHQREFYAFEQRPQAPRQPWAEPLAEEVGQIDETIMAFAIAGYGTMTEDERDERYCHGIDRLLFQLARTGRMGQEEKRELYALLVPDRYSRSS
jgi:hypothetical protein